MRRVAELERKLDDVRTECSESIATAEAAREAAVRCSPNRIASLGARDTMAFTFQHGRACACVCVRVCARARLSLRARDALGNVSLVIVAACQVWLTTTRFCVFAGGARKSDDE
jgi:hypothetical protein